MSLEQVDVTAPKENFLSACADLTDKELVVVANAILVQYMRDLRDHRDGYKNLSGCIAVYFDGPAVLVRVWDKKNQGHVTWECDWIYGQPMILHDYDINGLGQRQQREREWRKAHME